MDFILLDSLPIVKIGNKVYECDNLFCKMEVGKSNKTGNTKKQTAVDSPKLLNQSGIE